MTFILKIKPVEALDVFFAIGTLSYNFFDHLGVYLCINNSRNIPQQKKKLNIGISLAVSIFGENVWQMHEKLDTKMVPTFIRPQCMYVHTTY